MRFSFVPDALSKVESDLLAVAVFEEGLTSNRYVTELDRSLDGVLGRIGEEEKFEAKEGQTLLVHTLDRIASGRVLLVGLGKREKFHIPDTRRYAAVATGQAHARRCGQLAVTLPPVDSTAHDSAVQFLVEGVCLGNYRFNRYKSDDDDNDTPRATVLVLPDEKLQGDRSGTVNLALARGETIAEAVNWARDLVNEPASVMTPATMAELAADMAKDAGQTCKVLGPKDMEKQKMFLHLAVSRGSDKEPRFIHLTYRPRGKTEPKRRFVLVGKGVTFDSGGLSLKPTNFMEDMKGDMGGAAAVLGAFRGLTALGVKSEVHVLVPAAENMVSGSSYKIGDVITGLAGKSVEILNTDAEGRLLLADALAYGAALSPDEMIDVATLTGACVVALGSHATGLYANQDKLAQQLLDAGIESHDRAWHMPLWEEYSKQLKTNFADLANIGGPGGGSVTAACFLAEFTGAYDWAHLDIAGTAWDSAPKGATGRPVSLLTRYLMDRAGQ